MSVGKISTKEVATAIPDETIRQAARRMATRNVGTLVILDSLGRPSGLVSDRDLASDRRLLRVRHRAAQFPW